MTPPVFEVGVDRPRADPGRWIAAALLVAALAGSAGCNRVSETLGLSSKPANSGAVETTDAASATTAADGATNAAGASASTVARSRAGVKGATKKRPTGATATPISASFDTAPVAGAPLLPRDASGDAGAALASRADATSGGLAMFDGRSPVYSRNDPDVIPARLLTTQKGGPTFIDRTSDVNTMELVISKQGRVEQVKLVTPTKRMTDMLLLSGAKTWKFVPAMKNGQPVRYRTQFSWETVP